MEKWKRKGIELISGLALTAKKNPAVIPFKPEKTKISQPERSYFKRATLSSMGISPARLSRMLEELERERRANIHSIMVIKDGRVVCRCSHPGYDENVFHLSHSMSKTLTGIAIGYLVSEGKLDLSARVTSFFPDITPADSGFASMTVEHLLTMASGVSFGELGVATEEKWTDAFFSAELKFAPGEGYAYNSMNSYILSRIVTIVSGESLTEFLTPRLLSPLGITNFLWEKSPEGFEKGGFGVYMSCESWAKVGVTLLNGGKFEGRQVIPYDWVLRSTKGYSVTPEETGDFNYGYHIWCQRDGAEFLINGMLGLTISSFQ